MKEENKRLSTYPNNINPNANSGATLAVERAKLAMSLAKEDSHQARKISDALLDKGDLTDD